MATKQTCNVEELEGSQRIDRESGSLVMYRRFRVQRPGGEAHTVTVEVTESGTPQSERCDCKGYQFRRECRHITAVYEAGVLTCEY